MPVRTDTLAFVRPVPYLLVAGATQTITAPVRHGATGDLQSPDPASSTITITLPSGTVLASEAPVTVASSTAQYDVTVGASEALGRGGEVVWSLAIGGVDYVFRQAAYVVQYLPPNVVSSVELYARLPELQHRVPQAQGPRGDNVGWQPQIDDAYYELIQRLLDDGGEPWRIKEVTGYREWLITRALQRCWDALSGKRDDDWDRVRKTLYFQHKAAESRLKIQYDNDPASVRRAGVPAARMSPVGRPRW